MSDVEALYREVVLDHYRSPRHRSALEAPDAAATVHNPVCGDQVRVEVEFLEPGSEEGIRGLKALSARTRGCSIAVAAGSVMAELLLGRPLEEARTLRAELARIVEGREPEPETDRRLRAFAGVARFPSRRRCATLAWEALEAALAASEPGVGPGPDARGSGEAR